MNTTIKVITIILAAIGLMAIGAILYSSVTDTDSTRRRVEVLKSNKQGDPNANKYDFANDGDGEDADSDEGEMEAAPALDPDSDDDGIDDGSDEAVDEPTTVTITGQGWAWQRTEYTNGETVTPEDPSQYVAQFTEEKTFSSTTGCNNFAGSYTINGNSFSFGPIAATKRACLVPTLESEYGEMLSSVVSYRVEGDLLVFLLSARSGTMTFRTHGANENPIYTEGATQGESPLFESSN